jgi:hypothetical protein
MSLSVQAALADFRAVSAFEFADGLLDRFSANLAKHRMRESARESRDTVF